MMERVFSLILSLLLLLVPSCKDPDPDPGPGDEGDEGKTTPEVTVDGISGSFIQMWYVQRWTEADWDEEMGYLADAGLEYLILTPLSDDGSAADYSTLEKCLKSAKKKGVKIFVGTNFHDGWWSSSTATLSWLKARMEEGIVIAKEAYRRFHDTYGETLYGWYWDWEIDNISWKSRIDDLAAAWNVTLEGISEIDASMPLLFSPFMNPVLGTSTQYRDFFKELFSKVHLRKGDIFAPQDCVGGFSLSVSNVKGWLYQLSEAAKTVDGLEFWSNIEIFNQFNVGGETKFVTAPLTRLVDQISAEKTFASRLICFAYSHYMSPKAVREDYHNAYLSYLKTGDLPETGKPGRVTSTQKEVGTGVALTWSMATRTDVDGFAIYKNGSLLLKMQITPKTVPGYYFDYDGKSSDKYQIAAYNILGDEGEKVTFN